MLVCGRRRPGLHRHPARDPADHPLRDRPAAWRPAAEAARRSPGRSPPSPSRSSSTTRASYVQESRRRQGRRERALRHAPGDVRAICSASRCRFMDKTEVGRLMSRLQGDVNSMQEFLETSVLSVGDIALLFGIVFVMLFLDFRLGLLTLSVLPILFIVRLFWLPRARARLHGGARDELDRQRRARRRHQRRARGAEHGPPARQLHALRRQGARQPADPSDRRRATPRSWCRSSTR